jgi:hypothetical protein
MNHKYITWFISYKSKDSFTFDRLDSELQKMKDKNEIVNTIIITVPSNQKWDDVADMLNIRYNVPVIIENVKP